MKLIFNQAWHLGLPKDQPYVGAEQKPVEDQKPDPIAKPVDQSPKSPE